MAIRRWYAEGQWPDFQIVLIKLRGMSKKILLTDKLKFVRNNLVCSMWYTKGKTFTGNFALRDPGVSSDHKYANQITQWDVKSETQPAECGEVPLLHFTSVRHELEWIVQLAPLCLKRHRANGRSPEECDCRPHEEKLNKWQLFSSNKGKDWEEKVNLRCI